MLTDETFFIECSFNVRNLQSKTWSRNTQDFRYMLLKTITMLASNGA